MKKFNLFKYKQGYTTKRTKVLKNFKTVERLHEKSSNPSRHEPFLSHDLNTKYVRHITHDPL
jgi:hypothetical protein